MSTQEEIYGIQRSCYTQSTKSGEHFVKENGISIILSGEMEAFDGKTKHLYKKGDIIFCKKNTLIRFVKYAQLDKPFEAITVIFDDLLLKDYAFQYSISSTSPTTESLFKIKQDMLIQDFFTTIKGYFGKEISRELAILKKFELIHLLIRHNSIYQDILFNFTTPGKIDLEAFMNKNYRFNVPLTQFAFLTGRSLATFKRDFDKMFNTSPNKWMQQKRLEEAYYLLHSKKMKTKDVYLEVGFETLSHFSYAFKKHFGITPSSL